MVEERVDRTLELDGLANARDLGGLRRADGQLTPRGVFFRSDNVDRLSPSGWDAAYDAGIRTIVDLRQPRERERDTSDRPPWTTTVTVDLDGLDNREFWADFWDNGLVGTALYYLPHLQAMPERSVAALRAIVTAPPGGVLFHCMGGRDRTGMIAMLLLVAADVQPNEIIDDYLETVRRGELRAASDNRVNNEAMLDALCQRHRSTTVAAFVDALHGLDLARVLISGGLSAEDQRALTTWRGSLSGRTDRDAAGEGRTV
jgi:protein-tyrosine phosphatase